MMFSVGMWRHEYAQDVDFYITGIVGDYPDYILVNVLYWNKFYKMFHNQRMKPDSVKIQRKDFKHWSPVVEVQRG